VRYATPVLNVFELPAPGRLRRALREQAAAAAPWELVAPPADAIAPDRDDTLTLLFLCCHPALLPASQIAITLRAVGGLTTGQIARAFLV
jgi:predicted RNA polymerase sigma factor